MNRHCPTLILSIDRSRMLIVGMRTTKTAGGCDRQSIRANATR